MWVKSYVCVSESKLKNMLKNYKRQFVKWKEIDASIVSKIHVHFTQIYQGAAKLTKILKCTCELIRFEEKKQPTQVNHCNWMRKKSVQVGIIMTNFQKHTQSSKEISMKRRFEHLFKCLRFSDEKTMLTFCYKFFILL